MTGRRPYSWHLCLPGEGDGSGFRKGSPRGPRTPGAPLPSRAPGPPRAQFKPGLPTKHPARWGLQSFSAGGRQGPVTCTVPRGAHRRGLRPGEPDRPGHSRPAEPASRGTRHPPPPPGSRAPNARPPRPLRPLPALEPPASHAATRCQGDAPRNSRPPGRGMGAAGLRLSGLPGRPKPPQRERDLASRRCASCVRPVDHSRSSLCAPTAESSGHQQCPLSE